MELPCFYYSVMDTFKRCIAMKSFEEIRASALTVSPWVESLSLPFVAAVPMSLDHVCPIAALIFHIDI